MLNTKKLYYDDLMNQKTLFVSNNFFFLSKIEHLYQRIVYCPNVCSSNQKNFFDNRFNELKLHFSKIEKGVINVSDQAFFLGWDSHDERNMFKENIIPLQNRLFSELPFNTPDGFSSFRKKIEKIIPSTFQEAEPPIDQEVNNRLDYFFEQNKIASTYFDTRNELVGDDFSTKLSAFLACGALDVKYLFNRVKDYESRFGANKSTYWIIFELLWREFFYWHYHKHQTLFFSKNGIKGPKKFGRVESYEISDLRKIEAHPFFYACLNELENTGFLSNRARQIFASIWINDLELPWLSGARLFEEQLIDYDVYSNYGNWMYLAGVGVDPRGKRYFSVEKQLERYDRENKYLALWK